MISRVRNIRSYMPTSSGWGCMILRARNNSSNIHTRYQDGLHDLTGKERQIEHAYKVSGRATGSHGLGTTERTCLRGIRSGLFATPDRTCLPDVRTVLQDLTGSAHKITHAYKVSGRGYLSSRDRNTRSHMPTRYQEGVWNNRSNMPKEYQDGAVRSHRFRTPDRTCL